MEVKRIIKLKTIKKNEYLSISNLKKNKIKNVNPKLLFFNGKVSDLFYDQTLMSMYRHHSKHLHELNGVDLDLV
jgi:hypothetical protein